MLHIRFACIALLVRTGGIDRHRQTRDQLMDLDVYYHWTGPYFGGNSAHNLDRFIEGRNGGRDRAHGTAYAANAFTAIRRCPRLDGVRFLNQNLLPEAARIEDRHIRNVYVRPCG